LLLDSLRPRGWHGFWSVVAGIWVIAVWFWAYNQVPSREDLEQEYVLRLASDPGSVDANMGVEQYVEQQLPIRYMHLATNAAIWALVPILALLALASLARWTREFRQKRQSEPAPRPGRRRNSEKAIDR
jgi:hypothetical protein